MRHFAGLVLMRHWIGIVSLLMCFVSVGQNIAIGTWRTHFSYRNARIVEATKDKVFCAVENGLFSYDTGTGAVRRLSKIDGLSGAGVSTIHYNEDVEVLVIGYSSGLIDLIYEDDIVTIRDVFESNLEVGKQINGAANGSGEVFLATELGVIIVRLSNGQITENFFQIGSGGSQVNVLEVALLENQLFIITNEGIQSGNLDQNLLDFNNWIRYPFTAGFSNLTLVESKLFALKADSLYQFMNGTWTPTLELPQKAHSLKELDNQLYAYSDNSIYQLNAETFTLTATNQAEQINDLAQLGGQLYLADGTSGLLNQAGEELSPTGPYSDSFSGLRVLGDEVFAFHSFNNLPPDPTQNIPFYSQFTNGSWDLNSIQNFPNVSDVTSFNGSRYFTSVGFGLYNEAEGTIIDDVPGSSSQKDSIFLSLSAKSRLWVVGEGAQPVHTLSSEGTWNSYTSNELDGNSFSKVQISDLGVAWLLRSGQITVIDPAEMQVDLLSTSDGLPSSVLDFDISVEDNTWVTTSRGPALFPSASFIFFNSEAIRPTFENRTLFEDQSINTVVTDGGNRVWFGTNRGLWVFDENTSEQVAFFNQGNSPLPSDIIIDLAYNGTNGELFVVTTKGMISYRSSSSNGSSSHQNVSVFPNPVRPDYAGLVGISGLARNASLKVTDINGNLVQELDANGGTASWNLRDQNGGSIVTGIYFFFSSTAEGEETYVGKIAVIR